MYHILPRIFPFCVPLCHTSPHHTCSPPFTLHCHYYSLGRLCNFSPCIEQVQRVCVKLTELGYEEIFTVECLSRPFEVVRTRPPQYVFGESSEDVVYQPRGYGKRTLAMDTMHSHEVFEDEYMVLNSKRLARKAVNAYEQSRAAAAAASASNGGDDQASTTTATAIEEVPSPAMDKYVAYHEKLMQHVRQHDPSLFIKGFYDDNGSTNDPSDVNDDDDDDATATTTGQAIKKQAYNDPIPLSVTKDLNNNDTTELLYQLPPPSTSKSPVTATPPVMHVTRPAPIMRGHTGYLTFARKKASTTQLSERKYAEPFSLEVLGVARPGELSADDDDGVD